MHTPIETHPLPPFAPPNAKLLMLGSFPPPRARWKMDFYYPNFQNDMWRIFGLVFFADKDYFVEAGGKAFKEGLIRDFLQEKGIAISDTAHQVVRLQGNASDKFLQIVTPLDLAALLAQMPHCDVVMTTGELATDTLVSLMPSETAKPAIGAYSEAELRGGACGFIGCRRRRGLIPCRWRKRRQRMRGFLEKSVCLRLFN